MISGSARKRGSSGAITKVFFEGNRGRGRGGAKGGRLNGHGKTTTKVKTYMGELRRGKRPQKSHQVTATRQGIEPGLIV